MIRNFLVIVYVLVGFIGASQASPFNEWMEKSSKDYAKTLMEHAAKLSKTQKKEVILRQIAEAKSQKKWPVAIAEIETLIGQNPKDYALWLDLSVTIYKAMSEGQRTYELSDKAEKAAAFVYLNSNDKTQQALALLVSAALTTSPDTQEKCLRELSTLVDIKKLRAENPDYAPMVAFTYTQHSVDRDSNNPKVCFTFSHPIAEGFKPDDYFEITPKVDGAFRLRNTSICLTGIRFGESYNVTIKEGIPSLFGEKTAKEAKLNFLVDDKSPRLTFPTKTYILQKNDELLVPLTAVNVKKVIVKVVRVNDRSFIEGFARPYRDLDEDVSPYMWKDIANRYGEPLYEGTMDIGGETNKNITKQIPLSTLVKNLLPGAYGILVRDASTKEDYSSLSASQWVLITDTGMTVFKGASGLDVNVRSLSTAQPLNQMGLKLMSYNNQVLGIQTTNADGFAHFDAALLKGKGGNRPAFIFAYGSDGNFAAIKLSEPAFDLSDRGVEGRRVSGLLDAYPYSERGVYRPGETVRINTLLRNMNATEVGGIPLTFKLCRPDEAIVQTQTMAGNAHGFYEVNFPLSSSARTGQWNVKVFADPKADPIGQLQFAVEDFVPSRLLVTLKSPDPLLVLGKPITVDVSGRYLFGSAAGGLGGDASLVLRRHPNPFPQFKGYQFGLLDDPFTTSRFDLTLPVLDEEGKSKVTISTDTKIEATFPLQAVIQASIQDRGGRPQLGTLRLDVQSSPNMIGIKGDFKNGAIDFSDKTADLNIITVNSKSEQVAVKNLHYKFYEEELFYNWSRSDRGGTWEYKPVREDKQIREGNLSTASDAVTKLSVPIEGWGYYRVEIKDPATGAISSFRFTKGYLSTDSKTSTPDKLTVIQDKSSYANGETAQLHIDSPFDGEAILVIANQEVLETRNIKVAKSGTDISIKVASSWGTGAYVLVSAFRPLQTKSKDSLQNALVPKRAVGLSWIAISPQPRLLTASINVPKEVHPRQKLNVPLHIDGNTKTETFVTLAAVDEGILMLTDFKSPRPQDYFFGKRMLGVEMRDLYGKILDAIPGEMGQLRSGGDEGILARNLAALSKRSFRIVSLFQGPITLDGKGNATVPLDIPDFNGTLKLMLVAFNQDCLGSADGQMVVRDPIVSEPVLPRFLSVGDTSQMSLSLFNPVKDKQQVTLNIKAAGAIEMGEQTRSVLLEKDGAWHTNIPLKGKAIGDGVIKIKISGEGFESIERTFDITVRPANAPTSSKSTLFLQPGETKSLDLKEYASFLPSTASLMLTASGRIAWDLTSTLKSLMSYPYGCIEQTVSKGFAILYKKSMGIFNADESEKDLEKSMFKILSYLAEKQDKDGGFFLWSIYELETDVWLTAYVYDFMLQAKSVGYTVPEIMFEKAGNYLRNYVKSIYSNPPPTALATASYALSLIAGQNIIEDGAVRYFFDTYFDKLTHPLSRAHLGQALVKIGDLTRAKRAFSDLLSDEGNDPNLLPYGSSIRNKAALIKVMIDTVKISPTLSFLPDIAESNIKQLGQQINPSNPLSTQEQSWLLQVGQVLSARKQESHGLLAINDKVVTIDKSLSQTLSEDMFAKGVVFVNKGNVPLWINAVLSGFPKDNPKAVQKGVKIKKTYYTMFGQEANLTNNSVVAQGDQFVVVLEGELTEKLSQETINYMLVVDWLPAGFEIESGRLGLNSAPENANQNEPQKDSASSQPTTSSSNMFSFNVADANKSKDAKKDNTVPQQYPWENLSTTLVTEARDDRFVAAIKLLGDLRSFKVAYRVRAVTPGTYKYSGAHVEDMFIPTLNANTGGGTIEIKEKK